MFFVEGDGVGRGGGGQQGRQRGGSFFFFGGGNIGGGSGGGGGRVLSRSFSFSASADAASATTTGIGSDDSICRDVEGGSGGGRESDEKFRRSLRSKGF